MSELRQKIAPLRLSITAGPKKSGYYLHEEQPSEKPNLVDAAADSEEL